MTTAKAHKRDLPAAVVIDDDAPFRDRLARALAARGFAAHQAASAAEGLAMAEARQPALVTLDLRMPGGSGLDIVAALAALPCDPCILLLTGYGSIPAAVEAVRRGAADVLTKPVHADQVVAVYEAFVAGTNPAANPVAGALEETPTLTQVEWDHIQRVMADCAGNISEAARRLGLHRRSLQRKLEKRLG